MARFGAFDPVMLKLMPAKPRKLGFCSTKPKHICTSSKSLAVDSDSFVNNFKRNLCFSKRFICNNSSSSNQFPANMTNKPRVALQQCTNRSNACLKSHLTTSVPPKASSDSEPKSYHLAQSPNFRTMAGIQKLATEPTREHIENIRLFLRRMNAKNNDNQQITLEMDHETGIGSVCIRSAAKNGISGRMMCDLLDIIDELYSWNEGKGVIIYGHKGFFCSGK